MTRDQLAPLTGLRGIAVLLVIHSHYASWCSPFNLFTTDPHYLRAIGTSQFGMTLFFTLSGWVITYHYLEFGWSAAPLATAFRFLFLRLSRLYPVYLLFMVLQLKRITIDASFYGDHWIGPAIVHALNLHAWYPAVFRGELVDSDGYSISWSISTEIGMYAMFALALMACGRFRRPAIAAAVAAAAYVAAIVVVVYGVALPVANAISQLPALYEPVDVGRAWRWFFYVSPYFRFAEFIMGGAAAALLMSKHDVALRPVLSLAAPIAVGIVLYHYVIYVLGTYPGERTDLICAACFAVIMANARADTRLNRALSSRALILLGTVSYSLYLFHGLITNFAGASPIQPFAWPLFAQYLLNFALSLTFAAVMAYGLYSLIEMPAQRALRRMLPTSRGAAAAPALASLAPAE